MLWLELAFFSIMFFLEQKHLRSTHSYHSIIITRTYIKYLKPNHTITFGDNEFTSWITQHIKYLKPNHLPLEFLWHLLTARLSATTFTLLTTAASLTNSLMQIDQQNDFHNHMIYLDGKNGIDSENSHVIGKTSSSFQ